MARWQQQLVTAWLMIGGEDGLTAEGRKVGQQFRPQGQ
jgi:hypothetical protein